jgi:hypothetical protein
MVPLSIQIGQVTILHLVVLGIPTTDLSSLRLSNLFGLFLGLGEISTIKMELATIKTSLHSVCFDIINVENDLFYK